MEVHLACIMHKRGKCQCFTTWPSTIVKHRLFRLHIHPHSKELAAFILNFKMAPFMFNEWKDALFWWFFEANTVWSPFALLNIKLIIFLKSFHQLILSCFKCVGSDRQLRLFKSYTTDVKCGISPMRLWYQVKKLLCDAATYVFRNGRMIKQIRKIRGLKCLESRSPSDLICRSRLFPTSNSIKVTLIPL